MARAYWRCCFTPGLFTFTVSVHYSVYFIIVVFHFYVNFLFWQFWACCFRAKNFERSSDYNKTWKSSEDGTVNTNGPRVIVDQGNGVGPQGGFVTKYVVGLLLPGTQHWPSNLGVGSLYLVLTLLNVTASGFLALLFALC